MFRWKYILKKVAMVSSGEFGITPIIIKKQCKPGEAGEGKEQ